MKNILKGSLAHCLILCLSIGLFATSAFAISNGEYVRVSEVIDGDTLKVIGLNKEIVTLRLAQIDTPEMNQPWGPQAKNALSDLVHQKAVRLKIDGKDRYNRYIATLFLEKTDVNRALVKNGHAWAYREYLWDEDLLRVEQHVRKKKSGLWQGDSPIAPWQWRRGVRNSKHVTDAPSLPQFCSDKAKVFIDGKL